ncbi:MAG: hypothetical protein DRJ56_04335 [Thermoprotei archaeon]|nr:MAG: hypothetical protein DRJ56_04335 [Thermoprotei archaeon]
MRPAQVAALALLAALAAPTQLAAEPMYSYWLSSQYKLVVAYGSEAIINGTYSFTVDFTALVAMKIDELRVQLWLVRGTSYRSLLSATLARNVTVGAGWALSRTFSVAVRGDPRADPILLRVAVSVTVNETNLASTHELALAPVRPRSYDSLVERVGQLESEVSELEGELKRARASYHELLGNYSELSSSREELRGRYEALLREYEARLAELEALRSRLGLALVNCSRLSRQLEELRSELERVQGLYLEFKSKYEELSGRYEQLLMAKEKLSNRLSMVSSAATALGLILAATASALVYLLRERVRPPRAKGASEREQPSPPKVSSREGPR